MASGLGLGIAAAGLGWGLHRPASPGTVQRSGPQSFIGADLAFGTTITIEVVHDNQREAELAIHDALAAAKQVDRLMTLHRADSQVAILNRTGILQQPDPHVLQVLEAARQLSRLTDGAFDITVQPLWQAFSKAAAAGRLPTDDESRTAQALVDWHGVSVSATAQEVALARPGMAITLNGLAQGYAVDLARAALDARGIRHALLDTGEFGARGRSSAQHAWTVGIRDPRDAQAVTSVVPMQGRCVATSGDYQTVFTPDFVHHHIFDPASGDSPVELASVTVMAPTGLQADGLSTALMVVGARQALALVATLADVDVLLIDKRGQQWRSAQFALPPA
ncbi:FAD:protein FMN transferase [Actimicrobium antarcticum]|uniref:FAD:protein FMN transferase n=2 Tax=Actimicrobium antarcticum TaxID=1051899 RepID=A0ABP7SPM1_9BURK